MTDCMKCAKLVVDEDYGQHCGCEGSCLECYKENKGQWHVDTKEDIYMDKIYAKLSKKLESYNLDEYYEDALDDLIDALDMDEVIQDVVGTRLKAEASWLRLAIKDTAKEVVSDALDERGVLI